MIGTIKKCSVCGRKILVERELIGIDHTAGMLVTCWDCLNEEQKKKAKELYGIEEEVK